MAIERKWAAVPAQLLTSDGTSEGQIKTPLAFLFKVGQEVNLSSSAVSGKIFKVKRIESPDVMYLGDKGKGIDDRADLSAYLVSDTAQVKACEQDRSRISPDEVWQYVYQREPAMAIRNILVDDYGDTIGTRSDNPFYVRLSDGSINIGSVNAELEVQLSRIDNNPDAGDVHDSVRIGNQLYEVGVLNDVLESIAGLATVPISKAIDKPWDDIEVTAKTADGDIETLEVRNDGDVVRTLNFEYDTDGDFQRVRKS